MGMYSANKINEKKDKELNLIINEENNVEDEKIDKSSYEKTVVDNDSVITFDNLDEDKKKINDINDINIYHNGKMNNFKNKRNEYNIMTTNEPFKSKSSGIEILNKNIDIYLDIKNEK